MDQIIHTFLIYIYIILGLIRQPKWGHLKELHAAIKFCSATLLQGVRTNFSLGQHQEVMSQSFMLSNKVNLQRLDMVPVIYLFIFTWAGLYVPRRDRRVCGHSYK
jgi:hypothetical protein